MLATSCNNAWGAGCHSLLASSVGRGWPMKYWKNNHWHIHTGFFHMNASNKYKNVSLPKVIECTILYSEQQVLQTFFLSALNQLKLLSSNTNQSLSVFCGKRVLTMKECERGSWGYAQEKKLQSATSADSWDRQPQHSTFNPRSWKKRWVGDSPSCQMWRFNSHVDRDSVAPVTKQTETCASSRCWLHMTVG